MNKMEFHFISLNELSSVPFVSIAVQQSTINQTIISRSRQHIYSKTPMREVDLSISLIFYSISHWQSEDPVFLFYSATAIYDQEPREQIR